MAKKNNPRRSNSLAKTASERPKHFSRPKALALAVPSQPSPKAPLRKTAPRKSSTRKPVKHKAATTRIPPQEVQQLSAERGPSESTKEPSLNQNHNNNTFSVNRNIPMNDEARIDWLENALREIGQICIKLGGTSSKGPHNTDFLANDAPTPSTNLPTEQPKPIAAGPQPSTSAAPVPLSNFIAGVVRLTPIERVTLVKAAIAMLSGVFVHLPLKRSMHGIDPVQRLKLLRYRLETEILDGTAAADDRGFHGEMIEIFHSLRDLHTNYILPLPYQGKTAFLPFLVEEYFEGIAPRTRCYIVTKTRDLPDKDPFKVGVTVTHWNGIPIERAVELNAMREAGSNPEARLARGLEALTLRPMALSAPPDEAWVIIGFQPLGQATTLERKFFWQVVDPPATASGVDVDDPTAVVGLAATNLGYDAETEAVRRARKAIFDPPAMECEREMAVIMAAADPTMPTSSSQMFGAGLGASPPSEPRPREKSKRRFESADEAALAMQAVAEAYQQKRFAQPSSASAEGGKIESFSSGTGKAGLGEAGRQAASRIEANLYQATAQAAAYESAPTVVAAIAGAAAAGPPPPLGVEITTSLPDFFSARKVTTSSGIFGYIRIYSFMARDEMVFVAEFVRLVQQLPKEGLIIDVRKNGGGNILAGEKVLQVLCPDNQVIDVERFHLVNTESTIELCNNPWLQEWRSSVRMSIETGETYSQGFPLTSFGPQDSKYRYPGKKLLIIDALCYSTTDIFAAGFQDNSIGRILGTAERTGAGGANVWTYDFFHQLTNFVPLPLPGGANFRTAVRRSTRVGKCAGVPLEDLGVTPDERHFITFRDITEGNVELIENAARMLRADLNQPAGQAG